MGPPLLPVFQRAAGRVSAHRPPMRNRAEAGSERFFARCSASVAAVRSSAAVSATAFFGSWPPSSTTLSPAGQHLQHVGCLLECLQESLDQLIERLDGLRRRRRRQRARVVEHHVIEVLDQVPGLTYQLRRIIFAAIARSSPLIGVPQSRRERGRHRAGSPRSPLGTRAGDLSPSRPASARSMPQIIVEQGMDHEAGIGRHRRPPAPPPPAVPVVWDCTCGACGPEEWPRCLALAGPEPSDAIFWDRYRLPEPSPARHRKPRPDDPAPGGTISLHERRLRRAAAEASAL